MEYYLLTGATGLLGSYILRGALCAGWRVAVLARSSPAESARQRIDSILARWEREAGHVLPRPVVLEGDMRQPGLGLDGQQQRWVGRHCHAVFHSAASLSFQGQEESGEPYCSNVEGTRHVLDLCHGLGIRQYHHVSTAYVCGLRTGTVKEDELDVGHQCSNDYEKSKMAAEKLVHQAEFLTSRTIYRPSIIVGDSITGHTSTFHGFYTPLKIVYTFLGSLDPRWIDGQPLLEVLGLTGQEHKNLVPVDWVSAAIVELAARPAAHGKTYHLTTPRPVTLAVVCKAMERVLAEHATATAGKPKPAVDLNQLLPVFVEQMEVYRPYWRDDPMFDCTNTRQALPHLPCPETDESALLRTGRYALRWNFGWPRPKPVVPEFDVCEHLRSSFRCDREFLDSSGCGKVGLQVGGAGGGQWSLFTERGQVVAVEPGLLPDCSAICSLNSFMFGRLVRREVSIAAAIASGAVYVQGRTEETERLPSILQSVCFPPCRAGDRAADPIEPAVLNA
jgi:thioester reductase-like protein